MQILFEHIQTEKLMSTASEDCSRPTKNCALKISTSWSDISCGALFEMDIEKSLPGDSSDFVMLQGDIFPNCSFRYSHLGEKIQEDELTCGNYQSYKQRPTSTRPIPIPEANSNKISE